MLLNRQYSTGLLTGKKIGEKKRIFWSNCTNLLKNIGRNGIIIIKISHYRRKSDEKGNYVRNL